MVEKVKNIYFIRFPAAYNQIKISHACLGRHSIIAINNSRKNRKFVGCKIRKHAQLVGFYYPGYPRLR